MNCIADVTKAVAGTVGVVLQRVLRNTGATLSMTVLIYEKQVAELQASDIENTRFATNVIGVSSSVPEAVLQMVAKATAQHPRTVVFTFWPAVLAAQARLDPAVRPRVSFLPWSAAVEHLKAVARELPQPELIMQPISDAEAFGVLRTALIAKGATSADTAVKQTNLRPLLCKYDGRFFKTNPATSGPTFISSMLARAVHAGVVSVSSDPINPGIWQRVPSETPPATNGPGRSARIDQMAGNMLITPADRFASILRAAQMGPFANLRDDLYAALEKAVIQKLTMDKLVTECLKKVIEQHKDHKGMPWTAVRTFLVTLLSRQPVLMDSAGSRHAPGFQSSRTVIVSIDPAFRDLLDGELIKCTLQQCAEIMYVDIPALVGTIYPTREIENLERCDRVIALLKEAGAIQFVGETLRLAAATSGTVTAMPQRTA